MPTCKWLKKQFLEERQAAKDYKTHGFPAIAKDESRHARVLYDLWRKRCKR